MSSSPPQPSKPESITAPKPHPAQKPNPKKAKPPPPNHRKLPRLPDHTRISKRPLLHPPLASKRTSSTTPKIIYLSPSTPFIATVKRVRAFLSEIESRAASSASTSKLSINQGSKALLQGIKDGVENKKNGIREEEVIIKATGKAIEAALSQAVWWGDQEGITVRVRTGTVGAVDDVVERGEDAGGVVLESRVRRVSCLEVAITLV